MALEENDEAENRVDEGHNCARVIVSPTHDAWVARDTTRTKEKGNLENAKGCDRVERVRHAVGAKEGNPHGKIVASERHGDRKRGDTPTAELFARCCAVSQRVHGEGEGCNGENPNPAKWNRCEERSKPPGQQNQGRDTVDVSPTDSAKTRTLSDNELCRESEEVVDHRSEKSDERDKNDDQDRLHSLTLLESTNVRNICRGSLVEMVQHVLPPTHEQLVRAREVVALYLDPTPTAAIFIRGRKVFVKLESLQITGSFKIRGALAAIDAAHRDDPHGAVVTASAGNHGLGIAHASTLLGVRATVVVPVNASVAKVKKLSTYDIELLQFGTSYDEAQAHAKKLAEERSIRFISPFNDSDVIAGQSTVFDEMLRQAPELEHVVVSVGGGGLISGTLLSRDAQGRSDIRVTGVQPEESSALYHVLRGATMSEVEHRPTIADGLAGGGDDDAITNEIVAKSGIELVLVPEIDIRRAVRDIVEENGLVMEGSAAASYAAIAENRVGDETSRIGFIASGRNISHELLLELLDEPLA